MTDADSEPDLEALIQETSTQLFNAALEDLPEEIKTGSRPLQAEDLLKVLKVVAQMVAACQLATSERVLKHVYDNFDLKSHILQAQLKKIRAKATDS